ncbi:phosphatase PAP2 family protein [Pontiellaceae bacterium B12219]|nr:phosphatase PAP2 family protein [Pontiellaceae bacterium B12219]
MAIIFSVALQGLSLIGLCMLSGCGTLPNGQRWGQHATLAPGWDRVRHAAWNAASSPNVWAPVGTALLLQIDGADQSISDWAYENTPVFSTHRKATDASNALDGFSMVMFGITALATPSGSDSEEWTSAKLRGTGIQLTAPLLTLGTTELLKSASNRTRPNMDDNESFPSGHSSSAAVNSMLAIKNTDSLLIPGWSKTTLKTGLYILPYATGWARIEGGRHYPSDVLAGIALGNFFGAFINDAFLGVDSPDDLHMELNLQPDDTMIIGLTRRF